ncbi:MAG: hypothetical protein JNJ57_08240, partial [Saprospiraceae bacterium]|nr:hypothetical protein [Saprospiraceae bacterium]
MIKTTLFCCLALVLGAQTTTAQTVKLFQDSCHTYSYDGSTGELQGSTRCYLHYNAADLEDTSYYFNTYSGVTSYYRYTFTYNANDLLSNYLLVQGESATGPWANFLKEDYFYDTQDRNTQYVAHFGNSNGDWVPYFRETFWFDDVAPADSSLYELWNESASAWGNYRRYFNYYYTNAAL